MKKTLLAAALLAATSYATAASNVTLYGVLDAGVTVSKLHGDSTKVQMSNGNWMGNRWGIKGSEDLGNGNSVFFKLEQGFSLSNGNEAKAGKAFSREAALGVTGDWGTVAFGRFGALSSDCGSYSILGGAPYTTSFKTIGSMYSAFYLTDRYDNSIIYLTPEYNGFQGHFMYSNGRKSDENKWSYNQHYYGAGLTYGNGPLNADLIYEALDYKGAEDKKGPFFVTPQIGPGHGGQGGAPPPFFLLLSGAWGGICVPQCFHWGDLSGQPGGKEARDDNGQVGK